MPAPTPDQEKLSKLVNKFRGISQYKNIAEVPMDHATDLVNVMVSTAGFLEKFRAPSKLVSGNDLLGGNPIANIDTLFMFTQGNGTRQLFLNSGTWLAYYTDPENGNPLVLTPVASNILYSRRTRYVSSNNLLFGANGNTVWKWNGTGLFLWGLPKPATPPSLGIQMSISTIQRVGATITINWDPANHVPPRPVPPPIQFSTRNPVVGDTIVLSAVANDPTFNGNYAVVSTTGAYQITVTCQTTGNSGPFVDDGLITIYSSPCANTGSNTDFNITAVQRANGVSTIFFTNNFRIGLASTPEVFTVAGLPAGIPATFDSVWNSLPLLTGAGSVSFNQLGPDVPNTATASGTIKGGFTNVVGPRTWRFSWAISITGEEGPASDVSTFIPNSTAGLVNNTRAYIQIPIPPVGYGIDSFFLYASEDGGGTWNTVIGPGSATNPGDESWPINLLTVTLTTDGFDDSILDAAFQANFINYPPPQDASILQKFQGRIFLGGMQSAPQDIVYSGYDQIYRGRPETSYPPFNRIRLAIGADKLAAFGVLLNGVVAWDNSNKMYMFSGTIQDITTTQPVQIADQLEEEPWQVGCAGADTVQSTPRGVVWVGADMTVQIWNGIFYGEIIGPRDLTANFYPYMSRITPAMRPFIQSAFFNWLERDWYVLNVAVDGSLFPNRLFFFDLSQEGADNLGIWVSNIQCDSIAVKVDSKGTRTLVASMGGQINQLRISSTATNGIHQAPSATTALLDAFWESGYWQDAPHQTKMFRYGRLTTDQSGFNLITTVLNDETTRFRDVNPYRKTLKLTPGGRFATNRRGRRQKFRIEFPRNDADASVLELYTTAIPLADV